MKNVIFSTIFLITYFSYTNAQSISNITAHQKDNYAVIKYELFCEGDAAIKLYYSDDSGLNFKGPLKALVGDVGDNVVNGNKEIFWNVLSETDLLFKPNIIFRLSLEPKYGILSDNRDGNNYRTVKIGNQIWMAENLNYNVKGSECINCSNNGRFYNYNQAEQACPDGWILPKGSDFKLLLGNLNKYNLFESLILGGNSGFNALLIGFKDYQGGYYDSKFASFWASHYVFPTGPSPEGCLFLQGGKDKGVYLSRNEGGLSRYSVRCIKKNNNDNILYFDSQPTSFIIANSNLPVNEIPVEVYVKNYVEKKINEWQLKGEFEKTTDYQKRVNEISRNQKIELFTKEAIASMKKEFNNSINWNSFTLSQYDADNETYLLESNDLGKIAIPVPVVDAQSFKNNWGKHKFSEQDYYINSNRLIIAKLTITNTSNAKKYKYDSKQPTTYATNNITYTFKPIEVNVQQDNVVNNTNLKVDKTEVGIADVDINIPSTPQNNDKTFVIIIANENYSREVKVQYAANDGKVFKEYCEKTLGIPIKNIHYSQDATFGTMKSEIKWISDVSSAYNGQAKIIFYYAGHGMPNEQDKSAYLLPADGFSSDYETAIKLDDLYSRLNQYPTQSVTVFLDACFSGSIRDNGMLANARGVKINPKTNALNGKMIVFSAATGNETAYPYNEKQHGLFTYFLLKKLQETKGNVDYQTLSNYIIENVKQQSIVVNQKSQTPQVNTSSEMQNTWQILKIK